MKTSNCKNYDDLPLFLNASMVSQVLGVSPSSGYELMHTPGSPVLRVGSRMIVPKEKFIQWVEQNTAGGLSNEAAHDASQLAQVRSEALPVCDIQRSMGVESQAG